MWYCNILFDLVYTHTCNFSLEINEKTSTCMKYMALPRRTSDIYLDLH